MSSLALGTVQFGLDYGIANRHGRVALSEAKTIVDHAFAAGIDMLDTAVGYGDSEARLGEIGVRDWRVVSKLPGIPDVCADIAAWVSGSVQGSMSRLGVKSLYGLLLHRPQQLLDRNGDKLFQSLMRVKEDGFVQKIGVSIYDPAELDVLCERFPLDIVQAPFNLLDRRLIETGWMNRLKANNVELHVRSVFLQGLLLMEGRDRPSRFDRWAELWSALDEWRNRVNLSHLEACLQYVGSFPEISKVIVGVERVDQLREILRAMEGPRPELPASLRCADVDLLNPARWESL